MKGKVQEAKDLAAPTQLNTCIQTECNPHHEQ
jgi:hypothetical protein